ncbi:beta strand repeat-containing protein [Pararhizobium gei]|uniref:beta strand repeat-containing protein n=1 Tax=Pararhizobium gei TaxID=1395951 RepID=UPI0023DBE2CE|nr:cadherin-like domain-containing protein [Rhizobium gei]
MSSIINGDNDNNILDGTNEDDEIYGFDGDDELTGGNGSDLLDGGLGNDTLHGGLGDDTLNGGDGDDYLYDNQGLNIFDGGAGNDQINANGNSNSTISGGDGDDTISASSNLNTISGGAGNDQIYYTYGSNGTIDAGAGDDTINLYYASNLTLTGGIGRDTFTPTSFDSNTITDFTASDGGDVIQLDGILGSLQNYSGNNPFASGHIQLLQNGTDTLLQVDRDAAGSNYSFVTLLTLNNVDLTDLNAYNFGSIPPDGSAIPGQIINGDEDGNNLTGTVGDDEIYGFDGDDELTGGNGSDLLDGGLGNDTLHGGLGDDTLNGGDGDDYLYDNQGLNIFDGGAGNDQINANGNSNSTISGGDGDDTISASSNLNTISGGAGNDQIYYTYGSNGTIDAGAGDDTINLYYASNLTLTGGIGRDTFTPTSFDSNTITDFTASDGGDVIQLDGILGSLQNYSGNNPFASGHIQLLQNGTDTLLQVDRDAAGSNYSFVTLLTLNNVDLTDLNAYNFGSIPPDGSAIPGQIINGDEDGNNLTGTVGDDEIYGFDGDDELTGGNGSDLLDGGLGNDTLHGGLGDDTLNGGDGDDYLYDNQGLNIFDGGAGNDQINANGNSNSTISGGDGDDTISASSNLNTISGGAGNDQIYYTYGSNGTIDAGAGDDTINLYYASNLTLTGGIGRDTFTPTSFDSNTITDFTASDGGDVIQLDGILGNLQNYSGNNPFASGHIQLLHNGTDTLLQVDRDAAGSNYSFVTLLTLNNVDLTDLTNDNIGGYEPDGSSNDTPALTGTLAATMLENGAHVLTTSELGFTDPDNTFATFTATSITNGAIFVNGMSATKFTISQLTAGEVEFRHDGSETLSAGFQVAVSDSFSSSAKSDFSLTVTPTNDTPVLIAPVTEITYTDTSGDDGFGTVGDVLTVDDPDSGDTATYGVAGRSVSSVSGFDIQRVGLYGTLLLNSVTGAYEYRPNDGAIEALTTTVTESFTLTVNDGASATDSETLTITLNGTNDAPRNLLASGLSVDERAANGTVVGTLAASDAEGSSLTYELIDNAGGRFAVVGNELRVADGLLLDYEQLAAHDVTVRVTDPSGATLETVLTVNLLDVSPEEVVGDTRNNVIFGGASNDLLNGGGGNDSMSGGGGNDTYVVGEIGDMVFEAGGEGVDIVIASTSYGLAAGQEVEVLRLALSTGTAPLTIKGNEFDNQLIGNSGANTLDGKGGNDTMGGGAGDDTYLVAETGDKVFEAVGGGTDVIVSTTNYALSAGQEIETLRLASSTGTAPLYLKGNEFANQLIGNAGANTLDGKGGDDILRGGDGNDTYVVDKASDKVLESVGGGIDLVIATTSFSLSAGQDIERLQLALSTGTAALNLSGNELANELIGNAGANKLDGKAGDDILRGGAGDDIYVVEQAGDQVFDTLGSGIDTVISTVSFALGSNQEIETLKLSSSTGTAALDLTGNALAQTLIGNAGANVLNGGRGNDILVGGQGDDTYIFDTRLDATSNVDTITRFSNGSGNEDVIVLSHEIFTKLANGALSAANFVATSTGVAQDADDYIVYDTSDGSLAYDTNGSGTGGEVIFAILQNHPALGASDVLIV